MTACLHRLALPDGSVRLAAGEVESGPRTLLEPGQTVAGLLRAGPAAMAEAAAISGGDPVPTDAQVLAPVDHQEIWAAGVTYERSRDARMDESAAASVYDRVYDAARPELFFKAPAWRARGPGETVGVRPDSFWDVPEPELALVVTPGLEIAGYTIGNDVSSREIEGENPLYLPQAKVYDHACALGPAIVPATSLGPPFEIGLTITREGSIVVDERTTTRRLRRALSELVGYLGRALTFPDGVVLLTGTGIVPPADFTLRAGDVVRIEIAGLGVLENPVVIVEPGVSPSTDAGRAAGQAARVSP